MKMSRTSSALLMVLASGSLGAQTWIQGPTVPGPTRWRPIAFCIGTIGYCGGGATGGGASPTFTDFRAFDPTAQSWTPRATLPTGADLGFSIGTKGYITTIAATQNFWEYDPITNIWTVRADLPGGARSKASGFAMEGKGYVGGGIVNDARVSDFWEYDPASNTWTTRAIIPYLARHSAVGFNIGNKGYIVGGNSGGSSTSTQVGHRFDPVANTWTAIASIPNGGGGNGRQFAMAFSIGNKGFVGGGVSGGPWYRNRFDEYDPATNTWTQLADLPGFRYGSTGFCIGVKGYMAAGASVSNFGGSDPVLLNDFWEYNPTMISLSPKVFLEGSYNQGTGLMTEALRTNSLLPLTDPYGKNGYPYPGGNYSTMGSGVPTTTGNNAVVDRVIVELRNASTPAQVLASRSLWVQRDGDVVDMDGTSAVLFTMAAGSYHVAIKHRNHLGVMTAAPISLSSTPFTVDFTQGTTATYGTNARKTVNNAQVLWMGDVTFNGSIAYTGTGNDRDPILVRVGSTTPNSSLAGYFPEDVNMDGSVKYTGSTNDRDPILLNVGSTTPNAIRQAQLP